MPKPPLETQSYSIAWAKALFESPIALHDRYWCVGHVLRVAVFAGYNFHLGFGLPSRCSCGLLGVSWKKKSRESESSSIYPGSPKTKLCPLVVGNPLHESS